MPACTFFGHRVCLEPREHLLTYTILYLIGEKGVDMFYVGNQGEFDRLVLKVLRRLKSMDSTNSFDYAVVLAYMPGKRKEHELYAPDETMLPEGIEKVPPRFAISWRNDWMIKQSDYVIAFKEHNWGSAAKFAAKARRQGKQILLV